MEELEDSDFILIKGTHKKRAHSKLKVSDKAKNYLRVGVLKSGMHTAVLKEINSTCECLSKGVFGSGDAYDGANKVEVDKLNDTIEEQRLLIKMLREENAKGFTH